MASIVNIPNGSGKTPFEICDEQFFYCTSSEISTLGARKSLAEPDQYMQMGYTQLYFCERLILWDEANKIYQKYPESDGIYPMNNQYCVIGNHYLIVQDSNHSSFYSTLAETEEFMKSNKRFSQDSIFIVAKILYERYWH